MKWHETTYGVVLAFALFVTACTGSSDDVAVVTPEPAVETPTAAIEPDPTATVEAVTVTPEPVVTDQERVDAVVAALDAAVEAGEAPESLIAYDLLDSAVAEDDGAVTLTICGWTGDTVYDTVRDSLWRTSVETDGSITATHITTPVTSGECLNSHLIETAMQLVSDVDNFLTGVEAEPASFASDQRAKDLLDDGFREFLIPVVDSFLRDEMILNNRPMTPAFDNLPADVLWRRYSSDDEGLLELVMCRPMLPDRGTYRDDVLIDDGRSDSSPGLHSIDRYQVRPDVGADAGWRVVGRIALIWSDCTSTDDWPDAASRWQEAPVDFEALVR